MTIAAAGQGAKPQVVRALSVRDGLGRFEARQRRNAWAARGEAAVQEFIAGLIREVGPDFTPAMRAGCASSRP